MLVRLTLGHRSARRRPPCVPGRKSSGGSGGPRRRLNEVFGSKESSSDTVRALLASRAPLAPHPGDSAEGGDYEDGFRPLIIAPEGEGVQQTPAVQDTALNFSLCALNSFTSQPPPLKLNGVTTLAPLPPPGGVKEEVVTSSFYPNFEFLLNFDPSASPSVSYPSAGFL